MFMRRVLPIFLCILMLGSFLFSCQQTGTTGENSSLSTKDSEPGNTPPDHSELFEKFKEELDLFCGNVPFSREDTTVIEGERDGAEFFKVSKDFPFQTKKEMKERLRKTFSEDAINERILSQFVEKDGELYIYPQYEGLNFKETTFEFKPELGEPVTDHYVYKAVVSGEEYPDGAPYYVAIEKDQIEDFTEYLEEDD